jgi:hypothetical protein
MLSFGSNIIFSLLSFGAENKDGATIKMVLKNEKSYFYCQMAKN